MTDASFIEEALQKGKAAKEKARSVFSGITVEQLNWKPSPKSWSMAECLEHLIHSHSAYFAQLEKIVTGNYKKTSWERYSPLTGFCGNYFRKNMQEQVNKKLRAPGKLKPAASAKDISIIEDYHRNLDRFLGYISKCKEADLDKTILTSPFVGIVTYSLRDSLYFLVRHEHRHLNQAAVVRSAEGFPAA